VTVDDEAGPPVDEPLLDPADRVERTGERVLLRLGVGPPIGVVGQELVRRLLARAGDPVPPAPCSELRPSSGGHRGLAMDR
jgi:hypothetical protein